MAEGSKLHGDNMNALVGLDGVGFVHASGESTIDSTISKWASGRRGLCFLTPAPR